MTSGRNGRWYRAGLHFECCQCGHCCGGFPGYVWVTPEESAAIAAFFGISQEAFEAECTVKVHRRRSLTEQPNYDCVFLERDGEHGRCAVYPVRPQQCRTWPFWKMNLTDPDAWNGQVNRCSGINRGRNYTCEEIETVRRDSPC